MILGRKGEKKRKKTTGSDTYLFVNSLPAISALYGVLDDRITAKVLIQARESIERHA